MKTFGQLYKCNKIKNASHILAFFLLYLLLPVVYGAEPVVAQYVRITLPGDERVLSLAEVQVYSGERLISVFGKAKQVTTFRNATAEKAIDGNTSGDFFAGSVTGTLPGSFVWWELDLGSDQRISKIVIYNRTDCCAERINPAQIDLRNSEQKVVWHGNIESTRARYEFDVNSATTSLSLEGRNLLRNATFQQTTNPPLPDYWDLHHAAAVTFKDLHSHYGVDTSVSGPLPGVGVLKIVNSEVNFPYLILSPTNIKAVLPGGDYTYSVYVKADRDAVIAVSKDETGQAVAKKVSTDWRRYTFTFKAQEGASGLLPHMYFPKKATYFVAAPQLEEGANATPFDARYDNGSTQTALGWATQKLKSWVRSKIEPEAKNKEPISALRSSAEYDYYTTQDTARLWLSSTSRVDIYSEVTCVNSAPREKTFFKKSVQVSPQSSIYVVVPIKNLSSGTYSCTINGVGHGISTPASTVEIQKLEPNPVEVRVNAARRFFAINDVPFHIIGMSVEAGDVPDWYFSDLKTHGINTIFYNHYDIQNTKLVVTAAAKYDLKVIIGVPLAGAKPTDWHRKLSTFLALIDQLKGYPQIIGWFPVDEPSAYTWRDSELMDIYRGVKQADPYRLVFVNWAYDGVPKQVGQQPRGTLSATDVYAIDYYPFTTPTQSLSGFTQTTTSAALTARLYNKPFFSWLQLFGGGPAWREPTGAELNYMAYVNFIYGGMIGYWDTKSNSAATWEQLQKTNLQGKELAQRLFLSDDAFQLFQPVATESFLYTAWKKGENLYLIVLNLDSVSRRFLYDVSPLTTRSTPKLSARSMFEGRGVKLVNGHIDEWLAPYESKVYEMVPL